jgi:hypothetical protein
MALAKLRKGPMRREILSGQDSKRHILVALLGDLARGEDPGGVAIEQELDHHPRIVRTVATAIPLIGLVEGLQIQRIDGIRQEGRQVAVREPIPRRGRQEKRLFRNVTTEGRRHAAILMHAHDFCRAGS